MARELYNLGFDGVTQCQAFKEDGKTIFTTVMPQKQVNEILDSTKALANQKISRTPNGGAIAARIDKVTYHNWRAEWRNKGQLWGQPWHKFLKAKLNDPENKHMRLMKL